jgi:hypothetical protein
MVVSTGTPAPWSLGVLNQAGEVLLHRHMKAGPDPCLQAMAPSREALVVCVEGLFTWDWLADLCAREGLPFVLGHALSMKAIHGGKAKHETIEAQKIAVLRCGGLLPQADVYPAERRATRDLRRRRLHRTRQRAEWLAHLQQTHSQDHLPEIGQKLAYHANRDGVADHFLEPAVQTSIEVELARIGHDDRLLTDLELALVQTATAPAAPTFDRWRSIPGGGKLLALGRLYDIHGIRRVPRVQELVCDGRLVTCAQESAGKRYGTSGQKIGNASLTWAFSQAAVLCLRHHPAGQKDLARLEKKHGKGKALTVLAHTLARAVSDMLKRETAFALDKVFHA